MSDVIKLLPDTVANQIAAGEVIQRPASVIKELVENAIDAGATMINVLVVDAGRTSIQVIDNGKGMSETDARLSFERHATSKIREAADLFSLTTMGFRGEALASIAAVAQVELKTRRKGDSYGTRLSIAGSHVDNQEPVSCPEGSNFTVENLFFNVPARRKFLKTNATELNNILTAFERIVLVYPEVGFTLHSNGTELLNLKACSLRQRIIDVFGKRLNQDLLPVSVETAMCSITGFVGKPESAKKKGVHQYFFVNGRYMKHAYYHKAVMNAFDRMIQVGTQVPYFIYFTVKPEDIDVNIHPTKTEIKFENEQAIWQILSAAVKDSIGRFCEVPSIDFDTQGRPDIPAFSTSAHISAPKTTFNPSYNPFELHSESPRHVPDEWEQLYQNVDSSDQSSHKDIFDDVMADDFGDSTEQGHELIEDKSPVHYQYKGKYIMTAVKSGLMIIDQYRADTRVRFEHYLTRFEAKTINTQRVLFPEVVTFSVADEIILKKIMPELTKLGFDLSDLGGSSYAVNGVPTGIDGLDHVLLLQDLVADAVSHDTQRIDGIHHALALTMARKSAIPHGQILNNEEMENLINELFSCSNFNYTPDGKAILCILPQLEIEHLLG